LIGTRTLIKRYQSHKPSDEDVKGYGQKLENTTSNHEAKFGELKDLISGLASLSTKFYPAETITIYGKNQ
jgi:hypothetical protein